MDSRRIAFVFLAAGLALAQTDRGTITGTVADQSGAVVPNAPIEAKNVETGQVYAVASSETGNYTVSQLPAGPYELTVNVQGFKRLVRGGLRLSPTQILRLDLALEVGTSAESITVTAEATLLKTESGELATNVSSNQLNNLPLLGIGSAQASAAGIRNPWAMALLVPGAQFSVGGFFGGVPNMVVNGAPGNTASYRIEGMDAGNNGTLAVFTMQVQPSAEAIQEVAVQTSNYTAEFGAVGGGLFNATMRSGTNQYHGSLYDYNVNEAYNARQPFTGLLNKARRNNYGGSLGGPIRIPRIYDGADKTFFFFNWEQFLENQLIFTSVATVPTPAYRGGNFAGVPVGLGAFNLATATGDFIDPVGRRIVTGTIFDPRTERSVPCPATVAGVTPTCAALGRVGNNILVRDPFANNFIDPSRFDRVAAAIQSKYIPLPIGPNASRAGLNFNHGFRSNRSTEIPSLKIDQGVGGKGHLSFYWSGTRTADQFPPVGSPGVPEGFPNEITSVIANFDRSYTLRLNYDHSLSPTLLLHLGAGYLQNKLWDWTPVTDFDAVKEIGLRGATVARNFPRMEFDFASPATGGMSNMGGWFQTQQQLQKPAGNVSLTWITGNHSYKLGAEWRSEGNPQLTYAQPPWSVGGSFAFGGSATNQTALEDVALIRGSTGFTYASFLLGRPTSLGLGVPATYKYGKQQASLFVQDSWKVTRKLTLDYGLRWDYATYPRETHGRIASFSPLVANPSAGGHPGGVIYEATCNCRFAENYPYAIGPRIGVAYQVLPRTVLRAGFGIVYNQTTVPASSPLSYQTGGLPGFGRALFQLQDGIPSNIQPTFPNLSPGALPVAGTVGGPPAFWDPNLGRPARQYQWSVGLQREITRNLVVEASYVANRGVWWSAGGLAPVNSMSEQLLARYGFTIGNTADAALLSTQVRNLTPAQRAVLASRGVGLLPYNGFPGSQQLIQSLLPFPQYSGNISPTGAPLGKTWYDALQATFTQRTTRGLTFNGNFTWSKTLDHMSSPDIFNRQLGKNLAGTDLPFQFRLSAQYESPTVRGFGMRALNYVLSNWTLGLYTQYQSAAVLARPASANTFPISRWLNRGPGPAERVPGQPLFTTNWVDLEGNRRTDELDINCHCFDPRATVVLNPGAWAHVANGQWSTNLSTIRQFRGFRYPQENLNFGRTFQFKERVRLYIRAEFTNVFNRVRLPQPSSAGFQSPPQQVGGIYTTGFGTVLPTNVQAQRAGTLVARLVF
jgi:hypothetical protein